MDPLRREDGTDAVTASPSGLEHAGGELTSLIEQLDIPNLDRSLLGDDVIGHAGLAQALRDFTEQLNSDLPQLRAHADAIGVRARQAGVSYHQVDNAAADQFDHQSGGDLG